jgi:predicted phage baseplate assembly protein
LDNIPPAPAAAAPASSCIPPLFTFDDLNAPASIALRLKQLVDLPAQYLSSLLNASTRTLLADWNGIEPLPANIAAALTADLSALLESWLPVGDLLESGADDSSFVVEMDNGGLGHLRFGDGRLGSQPDAGMSFRAIYRVGNGTAGNVGAEAITYLVLRNQTLSGVTIRPRNPLPASGGTAHEPMAEVKLFAPHAIQDVIERAITADDYAQLAADDARRMEERPARARCSAQFVPLQGAKATLRWTGSWYEALVAIDPMNQEQAPAELTGEIHCYLEPYRRMGHDLTVEGAHYVPLDLALSVCLLPDYLRAHVEEALLQVFSNRVLPDGSYGFFHPNNLTFSEGIYISKIVAAAQAVTGVASVTVTRLQRYLIDAHPYPLHYGIAGGAVPPLGVLQLGPFEIAQLDNDPSFPENGRLEIKMRGGR